MDCKSCKNKTILTRKVDENFFFLMISYGMTLESDRNFGVFQAQDTLSPRQLSFLFI